MAYEIKRLEWLETAGCGRYEAMTTFFIYTVEKDMHGRWWWNVSFGRNPEQSDSLSAAKLAAEAHWQERMRQGLVEVGA